MELDAELPGEFSPFIDWDSSPEGHLLGRLGFVVVAKDSNLSLRAVATSGLGIVCGVAHRGSVPRPRTNQSNALDPGIEGYGPVDADGATLYGFLVEVGEAREL